MYDNIFDTKDRIVMRVFRSLRTMEAAHAYGTHPVTQQDLFQMDVTNVVKKQWNIVTQGQVNIESVRCVLRTYVSFE